MIKGKYLSYNDDLTKAFEIRKKVFEDEVGIDHDIVFDNKDNIAVHAVAFAGEKAVASGRILPEGEIYKIGKIAVLSEHRGNCYGEFIVRMLVDRAFAAGVKQVYVDALKQSEGFYKKLNFKECGEAFDDGNMTYQPMKLSAEDFVTGCGHKCI